MRDYDRKRLSSFLVLYVVLVASEFCPEERRLVGSQHLQLPYKLLKESASWAACGCDLRLLNAIPKMEYESLKDQWSDVEDRDGIRLSWNTFPSSRMVSL